ncbi:MAG: uroporphyrinogen-III synthase [Rhodobacter sp.]|nr:uroporphyrinogen-III synthase [Rhodobacter sp.]
MSQPPPALLLTRPRAQAERFAADCRAVLGDAVRIVVSPVLSIVPRVVEADLEGLAGVVLTSENGVGALAGLVLPKGSVAYCVGDRTAAAAEAAGVPAISAGGAVPDLVRLIRDAPPRGPLLYLRGTEVRGDLAGALAGAGVELRSAVAYEQVPCALTAEARALLDGTAPVVAPLFSPRSAALLGEAARGAAAPLRLAVLSPAVADAWTGPEPEILMVAQRPDASALMRTLASIYTRKSP